MILYLFKNAGEALDVAQECIVRGDLGEARTAVRKYVGKGGDARVGDALLALMDLEGRLKKPKRYEALAAALRKLNPPAQLRFGLHTFRAGELADECELTARRLRLKAEAKDEGPSEDLAARIEALAGEFGEKIGARDLLIPEIYKKESADTGNGKRLKLLAKSYVMRSEVAAANDDPLGAAELLQSAAACRIENHEPTDDLEERIREYHKTRSCWLCGRVATGEGVRFRSVPAEVTPRITGRANEPAKSSEGPESVCLCIACDSAIGRLADDIARPLFEKAMEELEDLEDDLSAEIAALEDEADEVLDFDDGGGGSGWTVIDDGYHTQAEWFNDGVGDFDDCY